MTKEGFTHHLVFCLQYLLSVPYTFRSLSRLSISFNLSLCPVQMIFKLNNYMQLSKTTISSERSSFSVYKVYSLCLIIHGNSCSHTTYVQIWILIYYLIFKQPTTLRKRHFQKTCMEKGPEKGIEHNVCFANN